MFGAPRHILRLLSIARTLARHDALFLLTWTPAGRWVLPPARALSGFRTMRRVRHLRPGQRLALALEALGPSFIKLGQALSTRSDLFGETMTADLSALQDRLPPFPTDRARATVEAELGRPIDALFAEFEDEPVAAASIAQVHFAVTHPEGDAPGERVAVKILRPGVEQAFERDLALLRWLAIQVERTQPRLRRLRPLASVETFADSVRIEMDLRLEAAAAAELAENFAGDPTFRVPAIDWTRTAQRVLTLERVEGIPIHDVDALVAAGHDLEEIVRNAATAFFKQGFRDGFFHADMHPGNVFVGDDGELIAIDFGIMGRLDRKTRIYLADMLQGILTGDYKRVAQVHFQAGYVPADKRLDTFTQALRSFTEPILGRSAGDISIARLLAQLFQVTEQFEMETQPQLLLLQKTILIAEGVGRHLAPDANMWLLAQPLIEDWMRENRGPEARVRDMVVDALEALAKMPRAIADVQRVAERLANAEPRANPGVNPGANAERARPRVWPLWLAVAVLGAGVVIALLL